MSWFRGLRRFKLAGELCAAAGFDPAPVDVRLAALLVFGLRPGIVIDSLLLTVSVLAFDRFFGVADGETDVLALAVSVRKTNSAAKIAAITAPITKDLPFIRFSLPIPKLRFTRPLTLIYLK